jgi:acyl-coenzyme A synthetase/AMP-(fatty) acid ligase
LNDQTQLVNQLKKSLANAVEEVVGKCKLPAEILTVPEIRKNPVRKTTRCGKFTIAQPGS